MTTFEIRSGVDLHDVQGNIIKGYGRYGFPVARYVTYRINAAVAGRTFIKLLVPMLTTSVPWSESGVVEEGTKQPPSTTNVALTYEGLRRLGVPERSLLSFPDEFVMGMRARASILGDVGASAPKNWDPVWQTEDGQQPVHLLVTINAESSDALAQRYEEVGLAARAANDVAGDSAGVQQLAGHRSAGGADAAFQDGAALRDEHGTPGPKEHFGYTDGISDPYYKDSGSRSSNVIGGGKRLRDSSPATDAGWAPLATGELLLGHTDEALEYPAAPVPSTLSKNGTYLVYRKLHQNVATFDRYAASEAAKLSMEENLFRAKLVGRWPNGAPLASFPTEAEANAFNAKLEQAKADRFDETATPTQRAAATERHLELKEQQSGFDYREDIAGESCPVGAHSRRANPRGSLEFGQDHAFSTPGALVNRRRIARRGLPYGDSSDRSVDNGDHGIIFMAIGASINRQFEFVQQQWMNFGNDFRLGNDQDALLASWPDEDIDPLRARMTFEVDPDGMEVPKICTGIPQFVETRGGDYFFVPSLTALSAIARGAVDPT